ncbi:glycoside hydrolase family 28 protein [Pedobacter agri]|uniref:glycoside hydrolase family 28 protein n=1 Tax=Pedobacter agri TaxID=454586 RepID=UPI00292FE341|nr:glycoside hydrolase family 28 protein [Pedobacter agri]
MFLNNKSIEFIKENVKRIILSFLFLSSIPSSYAQNASNTYSWDSLPKIKETEFKKDTVEITTFQAKADGITLNTQAINDAIKTCSLNGGGVVLVRKGLWLTGPIYLKSNVNLHLHRGATLLFTADKSQYKIVAGDYEGRSVARNESPINGTDLENCAITGEGIIDGNGDAWRAVGSSQLTAGEWKSKLASGGVLSDDGKTWFPSQQYKDAHVLGKSMLLLPGKKTEDFADMKDFLRPNLMVLKNCKRILLEGVIFQNSAAWCLHPVISEDLTIRKITVKNPHYAQNGDGLDLESCKNFIVENSVFDVGDDAICIKSGKDEEGRKRGIATESGIIRGNVVYSGHGGVVVGSEMSGGARNIFIENCTFLGTDKGLRFKSTRGRGGVVENIFARNIFMNNIAQEAIFFDMFYFVKFATDSERDQTPVVNEGTPIFKNMVFDQVYCNGANKGIFIRGLSEMHIQNISISNSVFKVNIGAELAQVSNLKLNNLKFVTTSSSPLVTISTSRNISFNGFTYNPEVPVLIKLEGRDIGGISLQNTDYSIAKKRLELKTGATEKMIVFR